MTAAAEPARARRSSVLFHPDDEAALAALRVRWPDASEMELVRRAVRLAARVVAPGVTVRRGRQTIEFFP